MRQRLQAAGRVFAAQGFQKATVLGNLRPGRGQTSRQSTTISGTRNASILRFSNTGWRRRRKSSPARPTGSKATPEERLATHVRSFLFRLLDPGTPAWHGQLMAREMSQPTAALDTLVKQTVRPMLDRLSAIVRDLSDGPPPKNAFASAASASPASAATTATPSRCSKRYYPARPYGRDRTARPAHHRVLARRDSPHPRGHPVNSVALKMLIGDRASTSASSWA